MVSSLIPKLSPLRMGILGMRPHFDFFIFSFVTLGLTSLSSASSCLYCSRTHTFLTFFSWL